MGGSGVGRGGGVRDRARLTTETNAIACRTTLLPYGQRLGGYRSLRGGVSNRWDVVCSAISTPPPISINRRLSMPHPFCASVSRPTTFAMRHAQQFAAFAGPAQQESRTPRQKTYAKKLALCRSLPHSLTTFCESMTTKCCERVLRFTSCCFPRNKTLPGSGVGVYTANGAPELL